MRRPGGKAPENAGPKAVYHGGVPAPSRAGKHAARAVLAGVEVVASQCENLVLVSNEVFSGGADYAGDTDQYLLALARVNNALAARADNVCRVVCGIPVYYKGGTPE